jgi:RNA polymerase sigma-70 factor (ECF subfamily)
MRRPPATDIARCLDRALRGDRAAIEELVRAETPRLHGIAWRIVGDTALAEDVVQEVFVRILERRSPVRRGGAASAWLARVTAHAAIDLSRRRTARRRREEVHAMAEAKQGEEARDAVADAEIGVLVAEGLDTLPVDVRAAIWLTVVEGDSLRRAGDAIGLPPTTIHRRVHEGLETLRQFLARRGVTAAFAVPLTDVLRRLPAPPAPAGLAARVLAGIAVPAASAGAAAAAAGASHGIEKGVIGMAAASAKKIGGGIAVLLLLGGVTFVADPFGLRGRREAEVARAPAAPPAAPVADAGARAPVAPPEDAAKSVDAPPVDPHGSILARAVYEDDQEPVPGVLVRAFPKGNGPLQTVTTDEQGEARFPRLAARSFQVYLQRGSTTYAAKTVDVEPGQESNVTLELPPGVGVDGIVVDGDGKPVAGASIWLTEVHNAFQGAVVAAAGEDGTFRLRHVELKCLIGARAPGFAPSLLRAIEGRPTSVLAIRIVLDQPGVAVEGVVVGPGGKPVAGAILKIVKEAGGLMWTPDGIEIRYAPLSARTDGDGAFALEGVPVGDLTIAARSEGLVPFQEPITVPAAGLPGVRIELEEGVTVTGTVRMPEGDPSPGAVVGIGNAESNNAHLSGDLVSLAVSANQDGAYRLAGVKPGEFEVRAHGHGKGKAAARFTARAGEEVRWDPQLTLGLEILGRVVGEHGKPIEKVYVGAEGRGCVHGWIWSGPDGRFRFSNCKEVPHTVSARVGDSTASVVEEDVMPGTGEVVLTLLPAARPTAFITGTLADPEGKPAEAARVMVLGLPVIHPEPDGSFRIGPLPAGWYQVEVRLGDLPPVTRTRELGAGETADLGKIQITRGGRIEARVRKPDGTPIRCSIRVMNEEGDWGLAMPYSADGIATSEPATAGDYAILLWQEGIASAWIPVRVEDGATASAEVVAREGVRRTFRLSTAESKSGRPVRVTVRAADGSIVYQWPVQPDSSGWKPPPDGAGRTLDLHASFAPGSTYSVEASVRERRATASFTVSEPGEAADPIVLDLR